jgi:hypothetical protein
METNPYEPGCGEPKFTEVPHVWCLVGLASIHPAAMNTVQYDGDG